MRIAALYKEGKRFVQWPLRVTYRPIAGDESHILIWAPKSLFKHAVDRNHLRRLMREGYRLEQQPVLDSCQKYEIAFNYMDKQIQDMQIIRKSIKKAIARICQHNN